jgi:hypothetical protein
MSRKKQKKPPELRKRIVRKKPSYLIIIATEGEETEPQYFRLFQEPCENKIRIEILPTVEGLSSPAHVLRRMNKQVKVLKSELQFGEKDQFWLVFDFDTWCQRMFDEVRRTASQKKYMLAVSNPCFELWLYLHYGPVEASSSYTKPQLENMLKDTQGSYNPSNLKLEHYLGRIDIAIENAKKLHMDKNEPWPYSTGTHVYLLLKEIRELSGNPDFPFRVDSFQT